MLTVMRLTGGDFFVPVAAISDSTDVCSRFLDISDRVVYKEKENEEGFLGLAFHPKFKENGQFFC